MTDRTVLLLPDLWADGPTQMATDEAMLESVLDGKPMLRFYTWTSPTLSLGYFQRVEDILNDSKWPTLPMVRRPTGGGAIVHHHELTYSLALPPGEFWQPKKGTSWACRFHHALIEALEQFGISAQACSCEQERGQGSFLCFQHHTAGDLLIDSSKVVGSAQRRPRGALLQHGSILLRQSEHAPQLPGITELSGQSIGSADLKQALLTVLGQREGWEPTRIDWPRSMAGPVSRSRSEKFLSDAWNRKR